MKSPREESIGAQMAIALQLMKRNNHHAIAEVGLKITMEQLAILEVLSFHGDMNMTELSNKTWKQNANITRIIDKLEMQKLVIRKPVVGDRRAYLLGITKSGQQLFNQVIPILIKNHQDVTSCLTEEEESITIRSMIKIIKHLSDR
ncbi:MAG: MarR family transcriptional regulator [Bacteroidota bacterium]